MSRTDPVARVAAALAAACLHPYGPEVLVAAAKVLGLGAAQGVILEWRPQDFSEFGPFEAFLLAGIGLALAAGFRLSAFRIVLLLLLLHLALAHVRHVTTLALSFDHRLIDGELGSRFLADLAAILADPSRGLVWG